MRGLISPLDTPQRFKGLNGTGFLERGSFSPTSASRDPFALHPNMPPRKRARTAASAAAATPKLREKKAPFGGAGNQTLFT